MTEWVQNCAKFPVRVLDTTCEEFKKSLPAQADKFGEAIVQPDSEPGKFIVSLMLWDFNLRLIF
jgi:hypothetical protein